MTKQDYLKCMAYLGVLYNKGYTNEELSYSYEFFEDKAKEELENAIKLVTKKSKYLPKIADLLEAIKQSKIDQQIEVLNYMHQKGYFPNFGEDELYKNDKHIGDVSRYERAVHFVETGNIPKWLLLDMREYYIKMRTEIKQLKNETKLLTK